MMTNSYETWLINRLKEVDNFPYEDIKILDKYPLTTSKRVLKILIENACLGQNLAPITLGRERIKEINKTWLKQYFIEVACTCIDFNDDWEFRRLAELSIYAVPELTHDVLELGAQSTNEEVIEAIEDYLKYAE